MSSIFEGYEMSVYDHRKTPVLYRMTTERIAGYLDVLRPQGARCLTVAASGDHLVNLFALGAEEVVTFDKEKTAGLVQALKIASIMALDFQEFQNFWEQGRQGSLSKKTLQAKIGPVLKNPYQLEWWLSHENVESVFSEHRPIFAWNPYLVSAEMYEYTSRVLRDRCVYHAFCQKSWVINQFLHCEIRDLSNFDLNPSFDIIILSNIFGHIVQHAEAIVREHRLAKITFSERLDCLDEDFSKSSQFCHQKPETQSEREARSIRIVRNSIWPVAEMLAPGGRMMAGYFYTDEISYYGNLSTVFQTPPGFSVEILNCGRCGLNDSFENKDNIAVIIRRDC
jgi:hypothetical protein